MILPILTGSGLGAVFGSFIAALVLRWPQGESVVTGRSRCDGCGKILGPSELAPLFSYVWVSGRARCCGCAIDPLHPLTETGAVMIGGFSFALFGWQGLPTAVLGWLLLALALLDARHFWLPDRLTGLLALTGLASSFVFPVPPFADKLIGLFAGWLILTLIAFGYRHIRGYEGLGGGDPKLLGAIAAWTGWAALPMILLMASLVGLALAACATLAGRPLRATMRLPLGTLLAIVAWPLWIWLQMEARSA